MARTNHFTDLIIWKLGMELTLQIHKITMTFPKEERYGLSSQIRKSAASVPANISEGWARNTRGEFNQFLGIALGSLAETQTYLYLVRDLTYIDKSIAATMLEKSEKLRATILKFKMSMP